MNISAISNYNRPIQNNYRKNNNNSQVSFEAEINDGRFQQIVRLLNNSNHPDKRALINAMLREREGQEAYTIVTISDELDRELAGAINTITGTKQTQINTCTGDWYDPYKDPQLRSIINSSLYGSEKAWDYKTGKKKPLD